MYQPKQQHYHGEHHGAPATTTIARHVNCQMCNAHLESRWSLYLSSLALCFDHLSSSNKETGTAMHHQVPGQTPSRSLDHLATMLPTLAGGHHTSVDHPQQAIMQCATTLISWLPPHIRLDCSFAELQLVFIGNQIDHNLIYAPVETTQTHKKRNKQIESKLFFRFQEGYSTDLDRT